MNTFRFRTRVPLRARPNPRAIIAGGNNRSSRHFHIPPVRVIIAAPVSDRERGLLAFLFPYLLVYLSTCTLPAS